MGDARTHVTLRYTETSTVTVTNPYYEFDPTFTPGAVVRATEVNTQYQAIQNAFDFLPGASDALTTGTATFAPESGSGNAYVVTMPDTRSVNQDGDEIIFFASHINTGAVTLNVDSIGAIALVDRTGAALVANDIISGRLYIATYDATNTQFVLDVTTNVVTNVIDKVQGTSTDDPISPGAFNATLDYENASGDLLAQTGFTSGSSKDFDIENKVWGGRINMSALNASGVLKLVAQFLPGDAAALAFDGAFVAQTLAAVAGGFQINNTLTGLGNERALTQSDVGITATTTELEQDTDPINTDPAKVLGYQVFNSTTGIPVWAAGSGDTDVWVNATGATAHTPV